MLTHSITTRDSNLYDRIGVRLSALIRASFKNCIHVRIRNPVATSTNLFTIVLYDMHIVQVDVVIVVDLVVADSD